jgi:SAM-dependent methyltransferase
MSERPMSAGPAAEDWAGEMGERWLANMDRFEGMLAPVGHALLGHCAFRPGESVVDIGCGAGRTSLDIARQVVPSGKVLGVDISAQLVAAAGRRAQAEHLGNVSFLCADATTVVIEGPPFDRLFSRFGIMFFEDAWAAFANLHTLLRAGGRADFSVWAPAKENPWIVEVMGLVGQYVELPERQPRAPGPFALDDPTYIRELLEQGGFSATRIDTWEGKQPVGVPGATPREAVDFVFDAMSFGKVLDDKGEEVRAKVKTDLAALFARYHGTSGIQMPGRAFFVTAVA